MPQERFRKFCLTWNNYKESSLNTIVNTGHSFIVVGKEVGELKGTPHYQIYVEYKDAKTFTAVIKKFKKKCNVLVARGNADQNIRYCSKEDMIFTEGEPFKQGARNDLKDISTCIKKGYSIRDMLNGDNLKNYQGLKCAESLMKYLEPPRTWKPEIIWRWGATGVGKTEWIYENYTDVFTPINFKWWEGYDAHETCLIDDIRSEWCSYADILKLTDRYQYRVESKGGSRQARFRTLFITSPYHPNDVWDTTEDKTQLIRRLHKIEHIVKIKKIRKDCTEVKG